MCTARYGHCRGRSNYRRPRGCTGWATGVISRHITNNSHSHTKFHLASDDSNHMSDSRPQPQIGGGPHNMPYSSTYIIHTGNNLTTDSITPIGGKICIHLASTGSGGDNVTVQSELGGGQVTYPQNGTNYGHCFTGFNGDLSIHFIIRNLGGPTNPQTGKFSANTS